MKRLQVAIIGQGRSGRDIHGAFLKSEANLYFQVAAVVETDEARRRRAAAEYPGARCYGDYRELFGQTDIDLVVNASYSEMHYAITKDLLEHHFHVLVEKPFARNYYECCDLINTASRNGVRLAVFQQTFFAPYYLAAKELCESGKLGEIRQVSIRFNNFARRWDWQTLQKKLGGSVYNTGPHPLGIALGLLGFDDNVQVVFSKLDRVLTSGDAEDYAKILLTAPGKPVVDVEINSTDAFHEYAIKLQGSLGTYRSTYQKYQMKYILAGENPEQPVIEESLEDENGLPAYCSEKLNLHEEEGTYDGTAFDAGTRGLYEDLYLALTEGKPLTVTCEDVAKIVRVIEYVHAQNPLDVKY